MAFFKEKLELEFEEAELNVQSFLSHVPTAYKWLLAVVLIAVLPGYFITRSLTVKIWTSKYQSSLSAGRASFANPKTPRIAKVQIFNSGGGTFSAMTEVSNDNLDLAVNQAQLGIKFYNQNNELVKTVSDSISLLPNQKQIVVFPRIPSTITLARGEASWTGDVTYQRRLYIPTVHVTAPQPTLIFQKFPAALIIQGDLQNQSPYQLQKVHLVFLLSDATGQFIGVSSRDEFTLKPFERRTYKHLWPSAANLPIARVAVLAVTDTLDPTNVTVPNTSNSASDLSRPPTGR